MHKKAGRWRAPRIAPMPGQDSGLSGGSAATLSLHLSCQINIFFKSRTYIKQHESAVFFAPEKNVAGTVAVQKQFTGNAYNHLNHDNRG